MAKITKIFSRQILDSRGNPTVETEITLDDNTFARASVPSGASTGTREAVELRDGGKDWMGLGVTKAVHNVNNIIAKKIINMEVTNQKEIDQMMIDLDGTSNKAKLGANAILSVSLAVTKAAAISSKLPLYEYIAKLGNNKKIRMPNPCFNVINGGQHADNSIDFQEYMISPLGAKSYPEAVKMASETFHHLKKLLHNAGEATSVGDEGGFAPNLKSNQEGFEYIVKAIKAAGYMPGKDIYIALDAAASEFYNTSTEKYELKGEQRNLTSEELINYYQELMKKYPIFLIEDGLAEQDWDGWEVMTKQLGSKVELVGDDIFVTNPTIFQEGINRKIGNAILIKVNQIGTVTETIETINLAKANNYLTFTSHRSGETEDTFIADLAVGMDTGQIKTGSMSRSERIAKYNQMLRISESIHAYVGTEVLKKSK